MYNSEIENSLLERESYRHMALAQMYGSSCYSQTSKERMPRKSIAQQPHSPRCFAGPAASGCLPCASIPQGIGPPHDVSISTHPSIFHHENTSPTSGAYWVEQNPSWSCHDQGAWKSFSQHYPVNLTQGMFLLHRWFILQ